MATSEAGVREELLRASDAVIEEAVGHADPMVLRGLLYQLTGDAELETLELQAAPTGRGGAGVAPASEAGRAMLRRKAVAFLKAYREAGAGPIGYGPRERLPKSLSLIVGQPIKPEALELMIEETALDPWVRSLQWQAAPDPARLERFSVTIIGAGMGGLNAAVQLQRAGIRYAVIEKNADVGGTWYENHYPGARVDTPSRSYTNLFGVEFPCPYAYGPYAENRKYYDWVADAFGLREHITFHTEVRSLTWNEREALWEIRVEGPQGARTLRSNAVISAVGFLNRPNLPELEGRTQFQGPSWHSARWPQGIEWRGRRIAVIGTGCTGYQLVPELALEARHVTVFQRTPQWLFPVPGYRSPSPPQLLWLDRNLPYHPHFMRFRAFYGAGPDLAKLFDIDPNFKDPYTCSAVNRAARERSVAFLASKLQDPKLVSLMTPNHPPWSARPVVVDPEYCILDAIQRDNVTLVSAGVRRITRTGIEAGDGTLHEVDAIVYATGFRANDFLYPMQITGRGGQTLEALWAEEGPRAYRGCMIPGFPNLWTLYGPNTNGGLPVAQFHEMTTLYALQCLERLILEGRRAIEVQAEAYWRYNRVVDEGNRHKVWSDPRAHNYWWTSKGRTASQIPFTGYEVREFLRRPDWADLVVR